MFGYRLLAIGYIFKESAEQSALFLTLFAAIWKKTHLKVNFCAIFLQMCKIFCTFAAYIRITL
jgi:hypothetical protein